jgi:hypothetical protein
MCLTTELITSATKACLLNEIVSSFRYKSNNDETIVSFEIEFEKGVLYTRIVPSARPGVRAKTSGAVEAVGKSLRSERSVSEILPARFCAFSKLHTIYQAKLLKFLRKNGGRKKNNEILMNKLKVNTDGPSVSVARDAPLIAQRAATAVAQCRIRGCVPSQSHLTAYASDRTR